MHHGAIHRHRQKTAEERLYMLARGWLAYPVTPVAHATTAEERLYMLTPTASGDIRTMQMRRGRAAGTLRRIYSKIVCICHTVSE